MTAQAHVTLVVKEDRFHFSWSCSSGEPGLAPNQSRSRRSCGL